MEATESVHTFADFLCSCWEVVQKIDEHVASDSFHIDWLQANWELIVEGTVCQPSEALEVYGEGADCNGASSRVLYPHRVPSHKIVCQASSESRVYDNLGERYIETDDEVIEFDRLVVLDERKWYSEFPPFDMVLGSYAGVNVVVSVSKVDFYVVDI